MARRILLSIVPTVTLLLAVGCSQVQSQSHPSDRSVQPTTVDIQGASEWKRSPYMQAYYELTVATFANGADIDVGAYESKSFVVFREFARANGRNEEAMVDHLKLIPRQVVAIVKEDVAVLNSYDSFWAALAGPD
jgi:hypothetical protein